MKYLIFCFFAIISWGFWGFMLKIAVRKIGWYFSAYFSIFAELILLSCTCLFVSSFSRLNTAGVIASVFAGIFGVIGLIMFNRALEIGKLTIVSPFTAVYPGLTILLAILFLNESVKWTQGIGIMLAIIAVGLMAI